MIDERECGWIFSAQRGNTTVPKVALDAYWFEQRIQIEDSQMEMFLLIEIWRFEIVPCPPSPKPKRLYLYLAMRFAKVFEDYKSNASPSFQQYSINYKILKKQLKFLKPQLPETPVSDTSDGAATDTQSLPFSSSCEEQEQDEEQDEVFSQSNTQINLDIGTTTNPADVVNANKFLGDLHSQVKIVESLFLTFFAKVSERSE